MSEAAIMSTVMHGLSGINCCYRELYRFLGGIWTAGEQDREDRVWSLSSCNIMTA